MNAEQETLAETVAALSNDNDPLARWALAVLRRCEERDGHWFSTSGAATRAIPAALRDQFGEQESMQPGRVLITWVRPELRNEQVTVTCGEKACIRPSHSKGNGNPYGVRKPQPRGRSSRSERNARSLATNVANETQALLALTASIGHADSVALVRSVQALSRLGVDAGDILRSAG